MTETDELPEEACQFAQFAMPIDFDSNFGCEAIELTDAFYVDDVGQFEYYRRAGHFDGWPQQHASVGAGFDLPKPERVACVNLSVAALDAAFAGRVYRLARAQGVGTALPL